MYLADELTRNNISENEIEIYKELIEYARTKYEWVDVAVKNAGYTYTQK